MSQDDIISVLKAYPEGATRKELCAYTGNRWIDTDAIRALEHKGIITCIEVFGKCRKRYKLIGAPEQKTVVH